MSACARTASPMLLRTNAEALQTSTCGGDASNQSGIASGAWLKSAHQVRAESARSAVSSAANAWPTSCERGEWWITTFRPRAWRARAMAAPPRLAAPVTSAQLMAGPAARARCRPSVAWRQRHDLRRQATWGAMVASADACGDSSPTNAGSREAWLVDGKPLRFDGPPTRPQ